MTVEEPLRLSDFHGSTIDFLLGAFERGYHVPDDNRLGPAYAVKRLMRIIDEHESMAEEHGLKLWTLANGDGRAVIGISWGMYISQVCIDRDEDGDWVEHPIPDEFIQAIIDEQEREFERLAEE